ncbi:hypothetical protein ACYOEI_18210 [Singulisphaera rosea]
MDPVASPMPIAPNSRIPRTIGILNIVFASGLLICGLCTTAYVVILLPTMSRVMDATTKNLEAKHASIKKADLEAVDVEAKAAKTDEEKAAIEAKRREIEARPKPELPAQFDLKQLGMDHPKVKFYSWVDLISAFVLNLLMLASGIGLVMSRRWGLKLGVWVAAIKIIRLVLLYGFVIVEVVPVVSVGMAKLAHDTIVKQQQGTGGPALPANFQESLARVYSVMGTASAVGTMVFGVIYPAIMIWLLTRPGAIEACPSRSKVLDLGEMT